MAGYQKINLEMVVFLEEADAVAAELNSAIDRIEESHTIFGGEIETSPVEHSGTRRKSALTHTLDAQKVASAAVKSATRKARDAYKKVI
ncbi:MAG TPA: hypothetical protein VGI45_31890 [Terracidiphilus sp.]|jgi:hypothetical protein